MKSIIFDLDGTLIDSMPVWNGVGRRFLIKCGVVPPDNVEEVFKSMSFEESHKYFSDVLGIKCSFRQMLEDITAMVKERYLNDVPLKPYVSEFLAQEFEKGTKMCVLTASEEDYALPAIKRLGIEKYLCGVYTCTYLGMSKTSGEIYETVAEKIGGSASDTVVFEDAYHGIINAKSKGFYTIAVEDKSAACDREVIIEAADRYIKSFKELIE